MEQLQSLDVHGALVPPELSVLRLPPGIHPIGAELLGGQRAPGEPAAQPPHDVEQQRPVFLTRATALSREPYQRTASCDYLT